MTSFKFFERARPVKKMSSINSPKSDGRKEKRKKFASHVPEIQLSRYYVALVKKKIDTCFLCVFDFIDHKVQAITLTCVSF